MNNMKVNVLVAITIYVDGYFGLALKVGSSITHLYPVSSYNDNQINLEQKVTLKKR